MKTLRSKPRRFSFSGWYVDGLKKFFFRSLKELSFVRLCEKNGQTWKSAETDEYAVWYTDLYGKRRKHYADFVVDTTTIVEVKPAKHQKGKLVQLKAEAMKEFCKTKGYTYQMISPRRISKSELEELIEKKLITFTDTCQPEIEKYLSRRRR